MSGGRPGISPADDYPLHQSARPFRDPGTDRNLYDRLFLNGYSRDGSVYFAVALGQYPGRDIMDAAVSVVIDGVQHNLRASRLLGDDRLDLHVGPITVRIVEPLRTLEVEVDDGGPAAAGSGMSAALRFTARAPVFEEAPFVSRAGHLTVFDYTRLTHNGNWSGTLTAGGRTVELADDGWWGTKDRSWGIRPVGEREAGGPPRPFSFFWLWAPMNFADGCGHFDVNEEPDGSRWHETAMWAPVVANDAAALTDPGAVEAGTASYRLEFRPGTRHARAATIELALPSGRRRVELESVMTFYMQGIGYMHPSWGHGVYVGDDVRAYDSFDTAAADRTAPLNLHVQELCRLRRDDGAAGMGILEQLLVGPHAPTGLTGLLDPHP